MNVDLLTIRDVAEALKLAEKTVYAMAAAGDLPAFKIRGQWRVRQADLVAWVADKAGASPGSDATGDDLPGITSSATAIPVTGSPSPTPLEEDAVLNNGSGPDRPISALTERVSTEQLHQRLLDALGAENVLRHGDLDAKPFQVDLAPPLPHRVRVYMYNATRPPGGRPLGEHKVQLIVPGQGRGDRGSFDHSDGRIVLLVGYAAEEDVFILWDAGLYPDFAWSRNVQVKAETIIRASAGKIATQDRQLRPPGGKRVIETVIAAAPHRLHDALVKRMDITRARMLRE